MFPMLHYQTLSTHGIIARFAIIFQDLPVMLTTIQWSVHFVLHIGRLQILQGHDFVFLGKLGPFVRGEALLTQKFHAISTTCNGV
jgi:hypothetical protein